MYAFMVKVFDYFFLAGSARMDNTNI